MGQSTYMWIFVMEDGETVVVEATPDYVMEAYRKTQQYQDGKEPIAILRGEYAGWLAQGSIRLR